MATSFPTGREQSDQLPAAMRVNIRPIFQYRLEYAVRKLGPHCSIGFVKVSVCSVVVIDLL